MANFNWGNFVAFLSSALLLALFGMYLVSPSSAPTDFLFVVLCGGLGVVAALLERQLTESAMLARWGVSLAGIGASAYLGLLFHSACIATNGTYFDVVSLVAVIPSLGMILQSALPRPNQQPREDFTFVSAAGTQGGGRLRRLDGTTITLYVILLLAAVVALLPFFWMVSTSLMTLGETINRRWLPETPQVCNYLRAWEEAQFSRYFFNSVIISFTTVTGMVTTSILAGYAFARINFWGRNALFSLLLITLMIPESVTMIPNFLIISGQVFPLPQFGVDGQVISFGGSWINSLAALTVPFMAGAFNIFMLRQFFVQIPHELWDAARIDGCEHLRFLIQVVLPISRAPILTVILLSFIGAWNNFLWPLIVTTNETWRPLMVGLYNFTQEAGTDTHLLMAGSFITILPMLLLYFMTQKTFTEGIATSGLKG
jgi:ABC-type glycerol-3-phosphate transport system permease component